MYKHNEIRINRKLNFEMKFESKQNPALALRKRVRDLDSIDRERKDIIGDSSTKCQSIMHEPSLSQFIGRAF